MDHFTSLLNEDITSLVFLISIKKHPGAMESHQTSMMAMRVNV
jgi:hypothetical protein